MAYIEYSGRRRDPEQVWRYAPAYFVEKQNQRLRELGQPELRCKGLPDNELDDSQLAWVKEARTKDRVRIAKAEALLMEVRSELARRK